MAKHNTAKLKAQLGESIYDLLTESGRLRVSADPGYEHLTWTTSSPSSWRKVEREAWALRNERPSERAMRLSGLKMKHSDYPREIKP